MMVPCKPHPFGNEYHLIADGDNGKAIMWRVKIMEGKDWPKKADGTWAFSSTWELMGHTRAVYLLLEMTKPIHGMGKVVGGKSGFCGTQNVIALNRVGVKSQFLCKKRKYQPKLIPGDYIYEYMRNKPLGHTEAFVH